MVEKAWAATTFFYVGFLKLATGSSHVVFPQLVNAEKSDNDSGVTEFQPKMVGKVFYRETSNASTSSSCS